ncbi:unnamed protein product, partial [Phaeothamnion confervicola]
LAGPVVAAAVILGSKLIPGLGDSKKKSAGQRDRLYDLIQLDALAIGVGRAEVEEIDSLNIFQATLLAMQRAVAALALAPDVAVIDGLHCPALSCPATAVVGGDASVAAISAASIIAKVTRDRIMLALHLDFPAYGFAQHKGYPTAAHVAALERCGASSVHRRSFAPVRRVLEAAGR